MDAALNEFMLVGVNIHFKDVPNKGSKGNGTNSFHTEFEITGQLTIEDFKGLRKACHEHELGLRCDLGNYVVKLRGLEYDSIHETFTLKLKEKL